MRWSCEPRAFSAYVSGVSVVTSGDLSAVLVDLRCKRVPVSVHMHDGAIVIDFACGSGQGDDGQEGGGAQAGANSVWPDDLGPWTGPSPTLTIELGGGDAGGNADGPSIIAWDQGCYSVTVALMGRGGWDRRVEIGGEA